MPQSPVEGFEVPARPGARWRRIAAQVGSFILAGFLLYLALRRTNLDQVGSALANARYTWLIPLLAIAFISHLLRAWRWIIFLESLPSFKAQPARRLSVWPAFGALLVGYMTNYAAPRVGEFVRSGLIASREKLSLAGVFGTVVLERVIDVVILVVALLSVAFLLRDRLGIIRETLIDPIAGAASPLLLLAIIAALLVASAAGLVWYRRKRRSKEAQRGMIRMFTSFADGLKAIVRSDRTGAIVVSTLLMWVCYLAMAHIPFIMLDMDQRYNLSVVDSWSIMNLGAIGMAIPSPGGTGSFHYITIQTLVRLFDVDTAPAASYAVLTHAAQFVAYVTAGVISLIALGVGFGSVREMARRRDDRRE